MTTDWNNFQFNPLPKGTYACDMRRFRHKNVSFEPRGQVYCFGDASRMKRNPAERIGLAQRTARLFVGLNVGQTPTYSIEDVVKITRRVRVEQVGDPSASFLAQRGLFKDEVTAETVEENSVQVVIFDFGESEEEFERQVTELGETLARELKQQSVYVELQRAGIPHALLKVTP